MFYCVYGLSSKEKKHLNRHIDSTRRKARDSGRSRARRSLGPLFPFSSHRILSTYQFSLETEHPLSIPSRFTFGGVGCGRGRSRGRRPSGPLSSFSARRVRSPYQFPLETEHIRYPSPRMPRTLDGHGHNVSISTTGNSTEDLHLYMHGQDKCLVCALQYLHQHFF